MHFKELKTSSQKNGSNLQKVVSKPPKNRLQKSPPQRKTKNNIYDLRMTVRKIYLTIYEIFYQIILRFDAKNYILLFIRYYVNEKYFEFLAIIKSNTLSIFLFPCVQNIDYLWWLYGKEELIPSVTIVIEKVCQFNKVGESRTNKRGKKYRFHISLLLLRSL